MPYGDLSKQSVQRFATLEDLATQNCTIEEMEEYEPYVTRGAIVYAGVDYEKILRRAEEEADVIVWDGGNNDLPFFRSDLEIVVADPHRAGDELTYWPGEANFRRADVIIIGKQDTAPLEGIETVRRNAEKVNPRATIINADMRVTVEDPSADRRQARPRGRGWANAHARRHEVRSGHHRRARARRRRDS